MKRTVTCGCREIRPFHYQTIICQSFINNSYYYTLIRLIKGRLSKTIISKLWNKKEGPRFRNIKRETGAFWNFSLSICFSLLLLNLVAGGKVNVPEPGSRRPFRIIGKLGNIVTSLWTRKYLDFLRRFLWVRISHRFTLDYH